MIICPCDARECLAGSISLIFSLITMQTSYQVGIQIPNCFVMVRLIAGVQLVGLYIYSLIGWRLGVTFLYLEVKNCYYYYWYVGLVCHLCAVRDS